MSEKKYTVKKDGISAEIYQGETLIGTLSLSVFLFPEWDATDDKILNEFFSHRRSI